jgi:hypothetical protein
MMENAGLRSRVMRRQGWQFHKDLRGRATRWASQDA